MYLSGTASRETHISNLDEELYQACPFFGVMLVKYAFGDPPSDDCTEGGYSSHVDGEFGTFLTCLQNLLWPDGAVESTFHDS